MNCPCGSETPYTDCCEPVINGTRIAATAEELMRARYTAYTQVEMDFIQSSVHPDFQDANDPEGAREWAEDSEWQGLEVIETLDGGPDDATGTVEFAANYIFRDEESRYHEVAEFEKIDGAWYFREGHPPVRTPVVREEPKIGRNDPCSCGSGRKFKRCCGA